MKNYYKGISPEVRVARKRTAQVVGDWFKERRSIERKLSSIRTAKYKRLGLERRLAELNRLISQFARKPEGE